MLPLCPRKLRRIKELRGRIVACPRCQRHPRRAVVTGKHVVSFTGDEHEDFDPLGWYWSRPFVGTCGFRSSGHAAPRLARTSPAPAYPQRSGERRAHTRGGPSSRCRPGACDACRIPREIRWCRHFARTCPPAARSESTVASHLSTEARRPRPHLSRLLH